MEESKFPVFFGEWVKKRRKSLDLTQEELAQRTGCTIFTVRKIESGERRPSKQLAELLSAALEMSPEEKVTFIKVARGELIVERLQDPSFSTSLKTVSTLEDVSQSSSVPLQPTPLIGRETEIAAMGRLLTDPQCRLLSLTGMGGIGKTRLAIEFATRLQSRFSGGIYYVPLASIQSTDAIVPGIADVLGFVFSGPSDPKDQLLHHLARQKHMVLLVLDNIEHLLVPQSAMDKVGIAGLISECLRRLPCLKVLVTSRERLNIQGEWNYELYGLAVPPVDFLDRIEQYSAVELFIQKARRVKADFYLGDADKVSVVRICQLLDGIPLAIELAAAWVGVLSCHEIAQEIDSNIDFLTSSTRDIPKRHQSIRASFDHSWKLLTDEERCVLSRLSVFRGGFDRMAADQIAAASLFHLASLVSKSLVRRSENGRYDLHEVIRQYASCHLEEDSCQLDIYTSHFEFYLSYVQARGKSLRGMLQQETVRQLTDELDNIRAAWAWAVHHGEYLHLGKAVRSLGWYFEVAGLQREGITQAEPLIQAFKSMSMDVPELQMAYGSTLAQQALLYFRNGEITTARFLYEESLTILRQVDDRSLLAESLVFMGIIQHLCGEYDRARALLEEGLALSRSSDERWFEAYAIYNLGYIDSLFGSYQNGFEQMMTGLNIWRALGDEQYIALGLNFLVPTLNALGRHDEAITNMYESIGLCEKTKNRWGLGMAYSFLGLAMMSAGLFAESQKQFEKSLEIINEYGSSWYMAQILFYLGEAKFMAGELPDSKRIYLDSLTNAINAEAAPIAIDSLAGLAHIETRIGQAEKALKLLKCIVHHPAITQQTKDRAVELTSIIESQLSETQLEAINKLSPLQTIEELANELTHQG